MWYGENTDHRLKSKYTIATKLPKELEAKTDFVITWQPSSIDEAGDLVEA
jgi:deoxyribodipyrimidine photo-lyase